MPTLPTAMAALLGFLVLGTVSACEAFRTTWGDLMVTETEANPRLPVYGQHPGDHGHDE